MAEIALIRARSLRAPVACTSYAPLRCLQFPNKSCFEQYVSFAIIPHLTSAEQILNMRLVYLVFVLNLTLKTYSVNSDDPISIHAPLLNRGEENAPGETSTSAHGAQPLKISTGRMKPITSPGSPRLYDADREKWNRKHRYVNGLSIPSVSSDPSSEHLYPKISVRPGKKDATVISYFHHPYRNLSKDGPYQYMQHERADDATDIAQPAKKFQIGLRKTNFKSKDVRHAQSFTRFMSKSQYHPKAALVHHVPGDRRAERKRPTIDVDQGRLHGNLLITSHGPESPPKSNSDSHQHQNQPHTSSGADVAGHNQSHIGNIDINRSPSPGSRGDIASHRHH